MEAICWGEVHGQAKVTAREAAPESSEWDEFVTYGMKAPE